MSKPSLNDRQGEAVAHRDGPLLIVAGAGAGKTKTITHRIARLIESGVPAHRILALTFTNKAAGEMRERVRALLGGRGPSPLMATFHSLGVRLLREFHGEAGIPRAFSIWDRDDSLKALKAILTKLDSDLAPRLALSAISRKKGDGVSGAAFAEGARNYREQTIARAWDLYEKALKDEGALDFDDLLLRALRLLQESPSVRSLLQERWHFLTIDEYQDTNRTQYEIARLLAGERKNICVVGDTDQNIYSWRGADIEHLLGFEEAFPGTKVVTLEQNYRSTRTILSAANGVIEKNLRRRPKTLFTENETGEPILLYPAQNEVDEAWFIAQTAAELIEQGVRASDIAVLYRENFQSRVLEEAFLHLGVPYRVLGTKFFERKEVKDALSYLRAALNPKSRVDVARIIATPARGIGKQSLGKMFSGAALPPALEQKKQRFFGLLEAIRKAAETAPCSEVVRFALEQSGLIAMHKADKEEGDERLGNVFELVNLAAKYDGELPPAGVERLLEEAALQSEQDELPAQGGSALGRDEARVALMTVHASKGLEFDTVFIAGLEQGLFPWVKEDDGTRDSEEERRLFYVALTRAKRRAYLSFARERTKYGSREMALPSEFLSDIDQRLVQYAGRGNHYAEKVIR